MKSFAKNSLKLKKTSFKISWKGQKTSFVVCVCVCVCVMPMLNLEKEFWILTHTKFRNWELQEKCRWGRRKISDSNFRSWKKRRLGRIWELDWFSGMEYKNSGIWTCEKEDGGRIPAPNSSSLGRIFWT
jgi:hypothetical protein